MDSRDRTEPVEELDLATETRMEKQACWQLPLVIELDNECAIGAAKLLLFPEKVSLVSKQPCFPDNDKAAVWRGMAGGTLNQGSGTIHQYLTSFTLHPQTKTARFQTIPDLPVCDLSSNKPRLLPSFPPHLRQQCPPSCLECEFVHLRLLLFPAIHQVDYFQAPLASRPEFSRVLRSEPAGSQIPP